MSEIWVMRYDHKMPTSSMMLPHHPFVKAVTQAMRHRCGVNRHSTDGYRMVVATSGGADSVALLRALAAMSQRRAWRLRLAVGHVHHHLRDDAEHDALFVAQLAQRLKLPFLRADLDLSESGGNLEAVARYERYKSLAEMAGAFGARYVVAAHHGDDQLETLLMRLLRGCSVRGLACMAWRRRLAPDSESFLIRPMLGVDREAVYQFLNDLGQDWRHDHTNADPSRLRARLRCQVLPVLRDIRTDAAAKAVALTDHVRQVRRLIESEVAAHHRHIQCDVGTTATLDRTAARQMHQIVLSALLRRMLIKAGVGADRLNQRTLAPIARAIRDRQGGRRTFEFARGAKLVLTRDQITVWPADRFDGSQERLPLPVDLERVAPHHL